MERTIKGVRGDLKQERQIAYAAALKALDEDKELNEMYYRTLRDIAETVLGMEFENNGSQTLNTNEG